MGKTINILQKKTQWQDSTIKTIDTIKHGPSDPNALMSLIRQGKTMCFEVGFENWKCLNPVRWLPEGPQQANCILIQSTPLCASVTQQHTIVLGICIKAVKISPLAVTVQHCETTVAAAFLSPCHAAPSHSLSVFKVTSALLLLKGITGRVCGHCVESWHDVTYKEQTTGD